MRLRQKSIEQFNRTVKGVNEMVAEALEKMREMIEDEDVRNRWTSESEGFKGLFNRFITTRNLKVDWDKIRQPAKTLITPLSQIPNLSGDEQKVLASKLVVVKLNGGLGTSMGCVGPKSIIEVRQNQTFLDLIIKQIQTLDGDLGCDVPLVLMNSFNTHEDTLKLLERYHYSGVNIRCFNQSRFPRILKETLLPIAQNYDENPEQWYPPGHGDFYASLYNSGLLDELLEMGKEYIFLSNVDNLAATVNLDILNHMIENDCDFLMEVTNKTLSDVKGGTLIDYEGTIKLLEIAQVPSQHVQEFKSIKKFKIFNTNNLWMKISAIKEIVESGVLANMDIIANEKNLEGHRILQLETAAGAAIQFFKNGQAVNVPRTRFLPVKSTSDLFIIQSDLYQLRSGTLVMNPNRPFPTPPIVQLGDKFKEITHYEKHIQGVVNILELDRLTISGDVYLGRNVELRGIVIIVANDGCRIDIPDGSLLENKVVTGNLRILEHS